MFSARVQTPTQNRRKYLFYVPLTRGINIFFDKPDAQIRRRAAHPRAAAYSKKRVEGNADIAGRSQAEPDIRFSSGYTILEVIEHGKKRHGSPRMDSHTAS